MDAFETVVATLLQQQGYWTQTSVKVALTKAEKIRIGRPSTPRWELDVVGYRGFDNTLMVVECKSYLDSAGVEVRAFTSSQSRSGSRYKLFLEPTLRKVVLARLTEQLVTAKFCKPTPSIKLCLAAGRIRGDPDLLKSHFARAGWVLWDPVFIRAELEKLDDLGYENSVAAVATKILRRGCEQIRRRS